MAGRFRSPAAVRDPLMQKIPSNPKYKEVRAKVDTGASMTKYLERVKEIKTNYKYKKGELFKRIKVTSLVGLMIEVAEMNASVTDDDAPSTTSLPSIADSSEEENGASRTPSSTTMADPQSRPSTRGSARTQPSSKTSPSLPPPPPPLISSSRTLRSSSRSSSSLSKSTDPLNVPYFPHPSSVRRPTEETDASLSRPSSSRGTRSTSSLQGLITGIGERSTLEDEEEKSEADKENAPTTTTSSSVLEPPYLLLDIREEDAFNAGHLQTAKNFPTSRLSRAFQFETKELRSFCNKEGKIIVVYDEDETMAPRAATILVERGYDNVYMLSGGINVARKFFPDGLVLSSPASTPLAPSARRAVCASSLPTSSIFDNRRSETPVVILNAEVTSQLRIQLEDAQKASSPSHRPTVQTCVDRRRTQMFGAQVKGKAGKMPVL